LIVLVLIKHDILSSVTHLTHARLECHLESPCRVLWLRRLGRPLVGDGAPAGGDDDRAGGATTPSRGSLARRPSGPDTAAFALPTRYRCRTPQHLRTRPAESIGRAGVAVPLPLRPSSSATGSEPLGPKSNHSFLLIFRRGGVFNEGALEGGALLATGSHMGIYPRVSPAPLSEAPCGEAGAVWTSTFRFLPTIPHIVLIE